MRVIGVSGSIGAGKSAVLQRIEERNCTYLVLYTDIIAKQMYYKGSECYNKLVEHFGEIILNSSDKSIDKNKLAEIIFNNNKELEFVNNLVHPLVCQKVKEKLSNELIQDTFDIVFVESAILLETDLKELVSEIVYIDADDEVRKERLRKYRKYSEERIEETFKTQTKRLEYISKANFIVKNNTTIDDAVNQLENWLK